jgi:hypothetical protein
MPNQPNPQRKRNKAPRPPQVTVVVQKPQPGKSTRGAKRTRTKRQRNKKNVGPNTLDSIERNLMRMSVSPRGYHPYVACRMNPFGSYGGSGIPDGSNSRYVVFDETIIDSIIDVNGSGFFIQTIPTLPFSALCQGYAAGDILNINGVTHTANASGIQGSRIGMWPLSWSSKWNTNYNNLAIPGQQVTDPYASTTARLVAVQYKLTYIGQPVDCAGIIVTVPNPVSITDAGMVVRPNPSGTGGLLFQCVSPNQAVNADCFQGTKILNTEFSSDLSQLTKDSRVTRQEYGTVVTPNHVTDTFRMLPTSTTGYGICNTPQLNAGSVTTKTISALQSGIATAESAAGVVVWWDDDWSAYQIRVNGQGEGAAYMWETAYCFEYAVAATSVVAPFSIKQSPNNPQAIKTATAIINSTPAGVDPHPR